MTEQTGEKFIVKVQLPLSFSGTRPMCLIYNENRSLQQQFAVDRPIKSIMGKSAKRYFYAEHMPNGELHIGDQAPDQEW